MEVIDKDKFKKADKLPEIKKKNGPEEITLMSKKDFEKALDAMQNPVEAQKRVAVQMKNYLDQRIDKELKEKGFLSDHTRRWVETYNAALERLQKALYGDKSANLHLHKIVSHSEIATKIREAT